MTTCPTSHFKSNDPSQCFFQDFDEGGGGGGGQKYVNSNLGGGGGGNRGAKLRECAKQQGSKETRLITVYELQELHRCITVVCLKRSFKKGQDIDPWKDYDRTKGRTSNNTKLHLQSSQYQSSRWMHTLKLSEGKQ